MVRSDVPESQVRARFLSLAFSGLALAIASTVSVACSSAADTTTVTLAPARDATLYQGLEEFSNGGGRSLHAGRVQGFVVRRALIGFDIAGALQSGAEVRSVTLMLELSRVKTGSEHEVELTLHRVLADWGEGDQVVSEEADGKGVPAVAGDATWTWRLLDSEPWAAPGGDFAPETSATVTVEDLGSYTFASTNQLERDVQAWLDDPASNFGWILLGDEELPGSAKRFNSSEHEDVAARPVLTVVYTTPSD